jgi:hypothetical protein
MTAQFAKYKIIHKMILSLEVPDVTTSKSRIDNYFTPASLAPTN